MLERRFKFDKEYLGVRGGERAFSKTKATLVSLVIGGGPAHDAQQSCLEEDRLQNEMIVAADDMIESGQASFLKDHGTSESRSNPEADQEGSYHHPSRCQLLPTWTPLHPSQAACQDWHPNIVSLHFQMSLGSNGVYLASDSAGHIRVI
nr:hypothetical protein Iba_chr05dCG6340 [Ipomoea batatas]